MKILFILPEYYPHSGAGISTYYLPFIKLLRPYCECIKVIVGSGYIQSEDTFTKDNIEVEYLKPSVYDRYLKQFTKYDLLPEFRNNLAAAWAMWEQAGQGNGFDLIECTDFGLGFIPWALEHHKPLITRMHGSSGQIALTEEIAEQGLTACLFQSTELALLPLSDALISHSKANAKFWNGLLRENKIKVIHPIYHTNTAPLPLAERENFGLVTARIQKLKGPEELCRAMELFPHLGTIKWYGRDMANFGHHQSMTQYLALTFPEIYNKRVFFEKPLAPHLIQELQRKAKFGIVPSTWDVFNFTTLEFIVAGTLVICSEGAGSSELIEHGKNGFKYPRDDIQALAECIRTVNCLDETTYLQITKAAVETIISILDPKTSITANIELYKSVVSGYEPTFSNSYFDNTYRPSKEQYTIDDILDKQTFKTLKRYFFKRIKSKLFK